MYPTADIELDPELPAAAQFWTPSASDLEEEEGFGFFRDTWPIVGISEAEAREMTLTDRSLCEFTNSVAETASDFDAIATAVETGSIEDINGLTTGQLTALTPYLTDMAALDNLEIGVAGLTYCLAAAGMYPAASCRGHLGSHPWSRHPVVFFAADRDHSELLNRLVREAECGFNIDLTRPELLVIESRSIIGTLRLADAILETMSSFAALNSQQDGADLHFN